MSAKNLTPPLRIFDCYVLRFFIHYLLFSLFAAALIFIIVDLIEHLDTFIDKKVSFLMVSLYYGYYLPYIIYLMLPVATLLATLFTVGGLSRNNELTAMKASGIGLHRILLHLLTAGLILSGVNFLFGETIVPYTNKRSKDIYRYHVKGVSPDQASRQGRIYLRERPGEMVHIDNYDIKTQTIYDLDWGRYNGAQITERVTAKQAVWRDSQWVVLNGRYRRYSIENLTATRLDSVPLPDLTFKPADLTKVQTDPEEMGYWQLRRYVERLRMMGGDPQKWLVELAFKLSMPFTCAIVVLLGVPISAAYRRSGLVLSWGLGLLISFIYFALQQIGRVMGINGTLNPAYAAWLGNAVFILFGLFLYLRVRK